MKRLSNKVVVTPQLTPNQDTLAKYPKPGICQNSTLQVGDHRYQVEDQHITEFLQVVQLTQLH